MASRLQDVILRGLAAARPLATTVAPGTLYYSSDTSTTDRCNDAGSAWETYTDGSGGGVPLHAPTHLSGGIDPVDVTLLDGFPGGTTDFLRADGTFAAPTVAATPHATTHYAAGTDPVNVALLAGFPGGGTTFLRDDGTFAVPPGTLSVNNRTRVLQFIFDGAGADIPITSKTLAVSSVYTGTITRARVLSPQTGSIVLDVWKDSYVNYPPTIADTITAAAKPTLSAANKSEDTTLTGWTVAVTAGDIFIVNVDSCTGIQTCILELTIVLP